MLQPHRPRGSIPGVSRDIQYARARGRNGFQPDWPFLPAIHGSCATNERMQLRSVSRHSPDLVALCSVLRTSHPSQITIRNNASEGKSMSHRNVFHSREIEKCDEGQSHADVG